MSALTEEDRKRNTLEKQKSVSHSGREKDSQKEWRKTYGQTDKKIEADRHGEKE